MAPIIDIHIHIAAKQEPGCRVSDTMEKQPAFTYMLFADGVSRSDLRRDFDGTIREHILAVLGGAPSVDHGVLLALDAIYARDGTRRQDDSHLVVTNEYVRKLAKTNAKVLVGASVHPDRGRLVGGEEVQACINGDPPAALFKWIPNSQVIDPSDPRHDWFYEALAAAGVPLLCHAGREHAVPVPPPAEEHQKLGDPRRLRRALDIGVTVIAAHAATRFFPFENDYLDELVAMMSEAEANGRWRLYADVSAMCTLCRLGTVDRVLEKIPAERMVLGSDYPIPVNDMPPLLVKGFTPEEYIEILHIRNPIEKNYRQLLAMGFPPSIGSCGAKLFPARALR